MKQIMWKIRRRGGTRRERAAAIVEFAVVLPLLLTMLFGIIEYGWAFMVRQGLQNAAREGARMSVLQSSVAPYTNVTDRIAELLAPMGLTTYTVDMTHATPGTPMETIVISIPYGDISLLGGFFGIAEKTVTVTCSMHKEGMAAG